MNRAAMQIRTVLDNIVLMGFSIDLYAAHNKHGSIKLGKLQKYVSYSSYVKLK